MRIIKVLLFFLILFISSCLHSNQVARKTLEGVDFSVENIIGEYKGKMPCVDCEAIETSLLLTDLHGFQLKYRYVGKSDQIFERYGNWRLDEDCLVLEGLDYMYKVGNQFLKQLDVSGNEVTGDIADKYILLKVKNKPTSH